jgi:hypothetical protein
MKIPADTPRPPVPSIEEQLKQLVKLGELKAGRHTHVERLGFQDQIIQLHGEILMQVQQKLDKHWQMGYDACRADMTPTRHEMGG